MVDKRVAALAIGLALCGSLHAQTSVPLVTDHQVCAPDGVAIGGYDVVSYHLGGPEKGVAEFAHTVNHQTYHFVSAQRRDQFAAAPEKYLPKYRGWCSATLSMGRLACPDFTNFKIEDGQLLLFERIGFSNGLDMWNADPETSARHADAHFQRLLREADAASDVTE